MASYRLFGFLSVFYGRRCAEMTGEDAVAVQSPLNSETDKPIGNNTNNVVISSNGGKETDSKSDFKMQDIVDMLSKLKLNPLAKEFFPSSYSHDRKSENDLVQNNKNQGTNGFPNNRRV